MWFLNKFKRRFSKSKNEKYENIEIKRPENSYDIYNQNETLTLKTDLENDFMILENEIEKIKTHPIDLDQKNTEITNKVVANKKEAKSKNSTNNENQNHSSIYIIYEKNDVNGKSLGWQVKKENSSRASKTYKTKEQTIEFVKNKATNKNSTCIIKNSDGSIDETIVFEAKNFKK